MNNATSLSRNVSLVETLDVALTKGVVVAGDVTISLADVDLIFVGLRLLLASVETSEKMRLGYAGNRACLLPEPAHPSPRCPGVSAWGRSDEGVCEIADPFISGHSDGGMEYKAPLPHLDAHPARIEKGLGRLVLTLVDVIRRLLEKQAMRRIDCESLSEEQIENLGESLMKLENKMEELRGVFGLEAEDLNLNLGPLGNLK
jgi:hypothetical protein